MRSPQIGQPNGDNHGLGALDTHGYSLAVPSAATTSQITASSSTLEPSRMEVKNTFLEVVESSNREPWRLRGMHSGCRSAGTTPVLWPKAAFPEKDPLSTLMEHQHQVSQIDKLISAAYDEKARSSDREAVPPDADPRYVELSEPLRKEASAMGRSSPYLAGYSTALSPQAPMWPATPEWSPWPCSDMRQHFLSQPALSEGKLPFPPSGDQSPFEVLWSALGEDKLDPMPVHDDAPKDEIRTLKAKKPPTRPQDSPLLPSNREESDRALEEEAEGPGGGLFGILDETSRSASSAKGNGVPKSAPLAKVLAAPRVGAEPALTGAIVPPRKGRGAGAADGGGGVPEKCRAFAKSGQCRFGAQCRFRHDAPFMVVPQHGGPPGAQAVVGHQVEQHWSQPSNSKGSQAIAPQPRAPSEVAVSSQNNSRRRWTVIWCDERAFKAAGAAAKKELEDLGMIIKAYKTAANCIRSLNKKLLPVLPCCLVISSVGNAQVLVPYLAERPALVRGIVVHAEAGQGEDAEMDASWRSFVKAVVSSWPQCMSVVKSIMDQR